MLLLSQLLFLGSRWFIFVLAGGITEAGIGLFLFSTILKTRLIVVIVECSLIGFSFAGSPSFLRAGYELGFGDRDEVVRVGIGGGVAKEIVLGVLGHDE